MDVQFAVTEEQYWKCYPAIHALRPHITRENYLECIHKLTTAGGKLIYIQPSSVDAPAPAIAVFRLSYYLYRGWNMYIDDFSTLPEERGHGYGSALMDFMIQHAKEQDCENIHLDSGYQKERWNAHRLYINKGFNLASHHFVMALK